MSTSSDFRPVDRDHPCEICGKDHWCRFTTDGAHECHRIHDSTVNGFHRIVGTPGGFSVYRERNEGQGGGPSATKLRATNPKPIAEINLAEEDRKFRAAISPERKTNIAQQLGVHPSALDSLGVGSASSADLKRLRAGGNGWKDSYPLIVATFPERDAAGALVGFCLRADDGRKGSPSGKVGAKRGLIIPATLPTRPDPVLLVEGPTDVAACETLCLAAVGRPSNLAGGGQIARLLGGRDVLVVGENDQNLAGVWPGREGAEKLAEFLAAAWKRAVPWALSPEGTKDVRAYLQHLIAQGLTLDDREACAVAGRQLVELLSTSATVQQPPTQASDKSSKDDSGAREVILHICLESKDYLFHDSESRAYAVVQDRGVARTLSVKSREYGLLLAQRYFRVTASGLPTAARTEAINTLEGLAMFEGPEEPVFIRIGHCEGKVIIDLCDAEWRVVIIDQHGWEVSTNSPVHFRRTRGMRPLPVPVRGGSINDLRPFVNVRNDTDFMLLCAFIIGCFNPQGPYIVLLVNGEAGAAKSCLCRLVRVIVDPNKLPLRDEPKDNRDLAIAANNSWMIALDNMSRVNERMSNALCRLATGGGFSTRELYSDSDEALFDMLRPVLINGIGEVAEKSDLLDRAVRITLPMIPEDRRQTERQLIRKFNGQHPGILGAFCDAVSAALRNQDGIDLAALPRMADSAAWVVAAAPACPWSADDFIVALNGQRREADEFVIEASPLATAIRERIESHGELTGTATDILVQLVTGRDEKTLKHKDWPKTAPGFGTRLREVTPNLRRLGIEVLHDRKGGRRRTIIIRKSEIPPESLSLPSLLSSEPASVDSDDLNADSPEPSDDSGWPIDDSVWAPDDSDETAFTESPDEE